MLLYTKQVIIKSSLYEKGDIQTVMKLGICVTLEEPKIIKDIGYSYIELNIGEIATKNESEYQTVKKFASSFPLPVYAFNCLFPGGYQIIGTEVDHSANKEYLEKAFFRASDLGGEVVVFGSGKARNIPAKFGKAIADEQMLAFLKLAGEIARKNDITVVLEPLPTRSTNFINTAREGLRFVKAVNHPHLRLLIDYWHLCSEKENPDVVFEVGREYLRHVHIANPDGGIFPKKMDTADYKGFITRLKKIGYSGGVSIEATPQNLKEDALESYSFLKAFFPR